MNQHQPKTATTKKGAVLVVGGGIGGIQTALDLAELGFKVYLAEKDSAIGGNMVKLDKTFPTNDCSMCMISPKLVAVSRHHNIEILTNAEVQELRGEPGRFTVQVHQQPRYVDMLKCTACGECVKVCPIPVPNTFDENLRERRAIYKLYPQATPSSYVIEKRGPAPCKQECPAHIHVQGYVALIHEGKYKESLELIRRNIPFPGVCGRVCTHPCETRCTRNEVDEPVSICTLKRFVYDWEVAQGLEPEFSPAPERPERIAIIGAGPAGLTAAYFLALEGYRPTIFEQMPKPGGMMRYGIPAFRLPREVLDREIEIIRKLGVEIHYGKTLGKEIDLDALANQGFQATFLGIGAWSSRKLGVEGEDARGVMHGIDFLADVHLGREVTVGKRVYVVGGGNVAIDVARTCLRLGAEKVHMICLESREQMPAHAWEVAEAEEEGIQVHCNVGVRRILVENGAVVGIECCEATLTGPDEQGRITPVLHEGTEFTVQADTVLPAIGQSVLAESLADSGVELQWGRIKVDPVTLETTRPGVFAGGDVLRGSATVIEAIAAGKRAAESIHRYLQGIDLHEGREEFFPDYEIDLSDARPRPRMHMETIELDRRKQTFDEVGLGFTEDQARAEAERCLRCGICSECLQCVEACEAKAIVHEERPRTRELEVGAVVLSTGFRMADASKLGEYGWGRFPNVVTSLEFERILSASGPYMGEIKRGSDGAHPKRIAFLQCVGSRDRRMHTYCSAFCCMQVTKEAIVAREHDPDIEATIFYMDIRAFGKGFEDYVERARARSGVRYVRSQISAVKEVPGSRNIRIEYVDPETGRRTTEEFDMFVLSVGVEPSPEGVELARKLGVALDEHGFCQWAGFDPVDTNVPGIFVTGMFAGPKDIPETVVQASAVAGRVSEFLGEARGTEIEPVEYPEPRDVSGEEPRIGVFVCHCGINIAGTIDVEAVEKFAATLPNVVYVQRTLFTCSQDSIINIRNKIQEQNLNRVVVASCTPRTHEPIFQDTLREAGLNPYLFEMANIREQCSWIHRLEPEAATEKAKSLVAMTVAKARRLEQLYPSSISVLPAAVVVGGGLAGMTAALAIAGQGYPVHLIEKSDSLGGNARRVRRTAGGERVAERLERIITAVEQNPQITVHLGEELTRFAGHIGHFEITLRSGDTVEGGAVIIATGAGEHQPQEYAYGQHPRIVTQLELEQALDEERLTIDPSGGGIVMIQCVGSRDENHPYCSRVCCTEAVKNALLLRERHPDLPITVLYRDIRTYGKYEDLYLQAREKGITFLRYDETRKPEVTVQNDTIHVSCHSPDLRQTITIRPQWLVLSAGIVAEPSNVELGKILKVPTNQDGFFLEAHIKLRPVEFASEGIFLAGLAHAAKTIDETIGQALAAAGRAGAVLSHTTLEAGAIVARVDPEECVACLTCVRLCPYGAPRINEDGVAEIDAIKCQGCGLCAGACPAKTIQLKHFTDTQIEAIVESIEEIVAHERNLRRA
jgi:heterodisulfide reductase subunit A-like polyferredoxin